MNRQAFELGLRLELEKLSYAPIPAAAAPKGSSEPSAGNKTVSGSGDNSPSWYHQAGAAGLTTMGRMGAWANKSSLAPTSLANPMTHLTGYAFRGLSNVDDELKNGISAGVNGAKPGEVVKPSSPWEQATRDSIAADPHYLDYAKQQATGKVQDTIRKSSIPELALGDNKLDPTQGDELQQQLTKHVQSDPNTRNIANAMVGNRTYGMAGVGEGLKGQLTPGNFQMGNFLNDHWGKLLAGGGLVAALMYALKGNNEEKQQQGPVINNYMGGMSAGQPQFGRMPGYNQ